MIALQGSPNYGLEDEFSDIDTKAIVLPTLHDIISKKQPVSFTHILDSNEHVDIKDIRLMHECFKKQNVNFIEILFTKYYKLNPQYEQLYRPMLENRERIARFNPIAAMKTMYGQISEKLHALDHNYPSKQYEISKWGFDPKQLHHIFRVNEFMDRYFNGEPYADCLISKNREYFIRIKRNTDDLFDLAAAKAMAQELADESHKQLDEAVSIWEPAIDKIALEILDSCLYNVIRQSLIDDLKE